ncbi:uncharacterized protein VICG_00310 [Vittaforma corneae ATCC 50505]|uniref:GP-PDE domain-containing protein n=1 Tax=Vittaforma corneae (strain ATCC 50505) TaxID=993615 RepID=L2GNU7_VITCO|nr:uncharacterized protein VICG_00310 [Vittaforma corneae ATCC 50505]ELA42558.1 hypothetical protein VICG_00310 [Vittaforma corneae ATCC 50505]
MNFSKVGISTATVLMIYYDQKTPRFIPEAPALQNGDVSNATFTQSTEVVDSCSSENHFLKKYINSKTSQIRYEILRCEAEAADFNLKEISVIGHRGHGMDCFNKPLDLAGENSQHLIKENTIKSFMLAHRKKAQMVEMDIHMTKDRKLVVFHDDVIDKRMVAEMEYLEFLEQTESTEKEFETTNTTLDNILRYLPDDLALYLEIKYSHNHKYSNSYEIDLIQGLITLLQSYPKRKIVLASFSPLICELLKSYCPGYKTCFLIGEESMKFSKVGDEEFCKIVAEFAKGWNIDGIVVDTEIVPRIGNIISQCKDSLCLMCYGDGANDIEQVKKLKEMGFSGFCTDSIDIYAL